MQKLLSKILISVVMVSIFLLPISPSIGIKNDGHLVAKVEINIAKAQDDTTLSVEEDIIKDTTASFKVILNNTLTGYANDAVVFTLYNKKYDVDKTRETPKPADVKKLTTGDLPITENTLSQVLPISLTSLTPNTRYFLTVNLHKITEESFIQKVINSGVPNFENAILNYIEFDTALDNTGSEAIVSNTNSNWVNPDWDFGCFNLTEFSISACIANFAYVIFSLAADVGHLAGKFLDFFVYYSTNSDSYNNSFVTKGWAAIRDVANMFFIIALIYVAIKTILGLGGTDSKKLIGYVIIIALLLNFSLFFTRVIIDGSNILAKIFYNNITSVDGSGKALPAEAGEQKSISVGLVDKFNPQNIVSKEVYDSKGGHGQFIFITILATAILLYMAYIFFSVALLFVSRVVMLWISMIFAPIAFASYTLPFDIPGLGHKEWWNELLKNAFLAPIFIFMLYIVVMFAGFLSEIVKYPDSADLMQKVMSTVIPFIILMVLLMKAKELAVKYSGEMGAALMKGAQMVGGLALGAATGGAAMLGRATIGRAGSMLANSEKVKKWESEGKFGAATLRNIGKATGKGSMDIRGVRIAGKDLASTGMKVGKAKEGGFEKMKAGKLEKRLKRAKELELGESSTQKQELNKAEIQLKTLQNKNSHETERLDKEITAKRQIATDANMRLNADPKNETKQKAANKANEDLKKTQDEVAKINAGGATEFGPQGIPTKYNTTNDKISAGEVKKAQEDEYIANNELGEAQQNKNDADSKLADAILALTDATNNMNSAEKDLALKKDIANQATITAKMNPTDKIAQRNSLNANNELETAIKKMNNTEKEFEKAKTDNIQAEEYVIKTKDKLGDANTAAKEAQNKNTIAQNAATAAMANGGKLGHSIKELKNEVIPDAHYEIEKENNNRKETYATHIANNTNKAINLFTSGGQHSKKGAEEAAYKIRMDMKIDSVDKGHH